jgi:hypothetical protein
MTDSAAQENVNCHLLRVRRLRRQKLRVRRLKPEFGCARKTCHDFPWSDPRRTWKRQAKAGRPKTDDRRIGVGRLDDRLG